MNSTPYNSLKVSLIMGSIIYEPPVLLQMADQGKWKRGQLEYTQQQSLLIWMKKLPLRTLMTGVPGQKVLQWMSWMAQQRFFLKMLRLARKVSVGNSTLISQSITQGSLASIPLNFTTSFTCFVISCKQFLSAANPYLTSCFAIHMIQLSINITSQIYKMNAKPRSRIHSQQPRRFEANRNKSKLDKELMLVRMSSFQENNIALDTQIQKLANTAKHKGKYPKSPYDSESNKARVLENVEERKSKHQAKKESEEKVKTFGISSIRKESQKYQLGPFFNDKEAEIMQAKLDIKQRKRKPKETKKLIYFTKGNNHPILKEIFITKFNFVETMFREHSHICWLQSSSQKVTGFHSSKSLYEDHLPQIGKAKTEATNVIYNYLQGQSQLTNKERLYKNMKRHCPESIGNYIPTSFIIDFKQEQSQVEESLFEFMKFYLKKETKKPKSRAIAIKNYFMEIVITNKQINRLLEKAQALDKSMTAQDLQEKPETSEQEATLWIFKPTSLNRGRGIHLFSNLKQLSKLLSENSFEISIKVYNDNMSPKSYIIQEYIDRPLLIDGYKFDMRVWVMLNILKVNGKKILKAHLFKHGYSRLASVKYNFVEDKQGEERQAEEKSEDKPSPKRQKKAYINNKFIHLTNNAVQKQAKEYGNFCEGNQLSIQDTVQYFQKQDPLCPLTFSTILQDMKKIVLQSVSSVKERLTSSNTAKTFQLLGYDFLIDSSYKVWLIEINCNPCLEESSQLLGKLLRNMLSGLVVLSELQQPKSQAKAEGWLQII